MNEAFAIAALWFSLAVLVTIIANAEWLKFLASTGAVLLTFLAGAELEPAVLRSKWKEVTVVGLVGFFPVIGRFRKNRKEQWYFTLLMSTGLTFGTISALYGYSHDIITQEQYSFLVAVVIASAVIPTLIATAIFLPRHLFQHVPMLDEEDEMSEANGVYMPEVTDRES